MFIFSLPSYVGALLAMLLFGLVPLALYPALHRLWAWSLGEGETVLDDVVPARIAVIHAVVIGMMFSNVTAEYTGMIGALESEASAMIRLYNEMERRDVEHFGPAMDALESYLHFVVAEQWPALREGRSAGGLSGRGALDEIWASVQQFDGAGRPELARLLDEVEHSRNLRVFDTVGTFLPLFWYAALVGYALTVITLCVKPPTRTRRALLFFYGSMVGVVLYGILVMTQPYSSAAGISPRIFERILESTL
jgi:hypothetical protein